MEQVKDEIEVGQRAPDFKATDMDGNELRLSSLTKGRKTVLVFYRGGWCPFCNEQLSAISKDYGRFKEENAEVLAVSSESVEKGLELNKRLNLPFKLLSDKGLDGIDAYGIRDDNIPEMVRKMGVAAMSKPSTFIIDESGIVRYKYIGAFAKDRPQNNELLRALKEMA
jgi:peroxiredoxin